MVVVGGDGSPGRLSSTEILDVKTMTWSNGPNLPISVTGNRGVESFTDTYLGFSTGGTSCCSWSAQNNIYGLKKTSGNTYSWVQVQSMATGRYYHSVVNAPTTLLPNC